LFPLIFSYSANRIESISFSFFPPSQPRFFKNRIRRFFRAVI
jgi:hypothetical protein